MGYFNFYLLRKILSNKKFRKIIIFLIVFLFIIIIKNNVFGFTYEYNNNTYTIPDAPVEYTYYAYILTRTNSLSWHKIIYITQDEPIRYYNLSNSSNFLGLYNSPVIFNGYTAHCFSNDNPKTWKGIYQANNITQFSTDSFYIGSGYTFQVLESNQPIFKYTSTSYAGTGESIYNPPEVFNEKPYFLNNADDIAIGGKNIVIMPGDFPNSKDITFQLQENNPTEIGAGVLQDNWETKFSLVLNNESQFYNPVDNTGVGFDYVVPWNYLNNYLTLTKEYKYNLIYTINGSTETNSITVVYGGNTPEDAIYNQGLQQNDNMEQLNNNINDLNNSMQNIEDTITDPTVNSGASDLPSTDVSNPAEAPLDNIFMIIYNAFCTGQAQDIVFPIPFTNKNITLSPYYVRDMLNNNGGSWVVSFADLFWQFVIAFFIIKDVSKKVNKIKAGDIENIENTNIKEDML